MSQYLASFIQASADSGWAKLARDRVGLAALEYCVIALVLVVAIIGTLEGFLGSLVSLFGTLG